AKVTHGKSASIPMPRQADAPLERRQFLPGSRERMGMSRFEDFSYRHAEAGEMRFCSQFLMDIELLGFDARPMHLDGTKDRINYPDQRNSYIEILLHFFHNFLMLIGGR